MLSRMRARLSYANVVATLALFLVLGGGTALGAFVVSTNSQIGPGTVSGHKPPTGDHSNIISGSVNGTDLATGAVTLGKMAGNSVNSAKVVNGSLLGGDIGSNTILGSNLNLNSVSTALNLQSVRAVDQPGAPPDVFYNHGAYTLTGTCVADMAGAFHARVDISAADPAFVSIDNAAGERFTGTESTPVAQTAVSGMGGTTVKGGEFTVASGAFTNHLSGHVLAVADSNLADFSVSVCVFTFEGIGE